MDVLFMDCIKVKTERSRYKVKKIVNEQFIIKKKKEKKKKGTGHWKKTEGKRKET